MTKQINTGVAELLLVKVPDDATGFSMCFHSTRMIFKTSDVSYPRTVGGDAFIDFDRGPKRMLGFAHDLTEEVWATIVAKTYGPDSDEPDRYLDYWENEWIAFTATESGLSLLRANECYAVNPYGKTRPWIHDEDAGTDREHLGYNWDHAQQNTGKWIALKPIKS